MLDTLQDNWPDSGPDFPLTKGSKAPIFVFARLSCSVGGYVKIQKIQSGPQRFEIANIKHVQPNHTDQ